MFVTAPPAAITPPQRGEQVRGAGGMRMVRVSWAARCFSQCSCRAVLQSVRALPMREGSFLGAKSSIACRGAFSGPGRGQRRRE